ncbi:acetyltransferase, GNAT family [Verrucomicrobiia bacterium DG1235]|nr:acetyltransferase, GNAT family [Verrucomicrobiae bacterium DG1235]
MADSPDAFGSTLEKEKSFAEQDWKRRLARKDCLTLVAESPDKKSCGLIVGAPYENHAGVFSMWIDPDFRSIGLGSRLIKEVIDWATQLEKEQILLDVGDDNLPAIKLYQSNGFKPTGTVGSLPPPRDHIKEHQRSKKLKQRNANKSADTTPASAPR